MAGIVAYLKTRAHRHRVFVRPQANVEIVGEEGHGLAFGIGGRSAGGWVGQLLGVFRLGCLVVGAGEVEDGLDRQMADAL